MCFHIGVHLPTELSQEREAARALWHEAAVSATALHAASSALEAAEGGLRAGLLHAAPPPPPPPPPRARYAAAACLGAFFGTPVTGALLVAELLKAPALVLPSLIAAVLARALLKSSE